MALPLGTLRVKLLVNRQTNTVVYAEAGKEFVDFLLGLMELPVGSILRQFYHSSNPGSQLGGLSLGKIYTSARSLDKSFLQRSDTHVRIPVINPYETPSNTPVLQALIPLPRPNDNPSSSHQQQNYTANGYVRSRVVYMVMDDLTIQTPSTISSINRITHSGVKNIGMLEEMTVQVDGAMALMLVRAAFQSRTVLTDVFLRNVIPR